MTARIPDEDVRLLATLADSPEEDYPDVDPAWEGSPFEWILSKPSRTIGAIDEKLIAGFSAAKGSDVARPPNSDCDRIINGKRVEIKFSRLWETGLYKFKQLRDQEYDYAICLGISSFDAHCWVLPKALIMTQWGRADGLPHQHGGAAGSDTVWLSVKPHEISPGWNPVEVDCVRSSNRCGHGRAVLNG